MAIRAMPMRMYMEQRTNLVLTGATPPWSTSSSWATASPGTCWRQGHNKGHSMSWQWTYHVTKSNGAKGYEAKVGSIEKSPTFPFTEENSASTNIADHDKKTEGDWNSDIVQGYVFAFNTSNHDRLEVFISRVFWSHDIRSTTWSCRHRTLSGASISGLAIPLPDAMLDVESSWGCPDASADPFCDPCKVGATPWTWCGRYWIRNCSVLFRMPPGVAAIGWDWGALWHLHSLE